VVLGYISGAGLLIGVGQLPNVTATLGGTGNVLQRVGTWLEGLGATNPLAVTMALVTAVSILGLRRINRKIPGPIIVLGAATAISYFMGLPAQGIQVLADLSPVPGGFPPFSMPDFSVAWRLLPLAVAVTVLSLVEATSVARGIAAQSGQRLDTSAEFSGQGLANIVAGFCGAYPTSGSLARSALNYTLGAQSRLSGVYAGMMMLVVLLVLGPVVNHTPIAALAGLLVVVAIGLWDIPRIKVTLSGPWSDRIAFLATLVGTWFLPLDKAIYLGVGISIVLFLRQARLLVIHELGVDKDNRLRDVYQSE